MYPSYENRGGAKYTAYPAPTAPMNVATGQPYPSHHNSSAGPGGTVPWSTGLCHCCDDPANCLVTAFCPCITFGQISELVNQGQTSCAKSGTIYGILLGFTGFPCLYSCFYRSRLRGQYDLDEAPFADCLVHFCCEPCSLCQEYRELKNRGFDMGIGWQANVDRQKRGMTMPPPVVSMMR